MKKYHKFTIYTIYYTITGVTGEKAHMMSPKEQGETTTILTFANACGQVFPPLVIFKGAKVSDVWQTNVPPNVTVRLSPKGWINKDVFLNYAVRWVHWLERNQRLGKPHLLLLDAHKSHIFNLPFLLLMVANKIEKLAIPGHTPHVLQKCNVIKISDLGPSGATDNLANLQGNNSQVKNCILK